MTKHTVTFLFGLTLLFNQVSGQNFKQQYQELVSQKDTLSQIQLLEKWEKTAENDPELYVAYFNYYVKKSMKDIITLGNNPKGENVFQVMDKDSTRKEPVGYIYGDTSYDPDLLNKGFNAIEKGIEKHPNRLDMRFGRIYMYGKLEDYEKFTTEIIKTIDHSAVIKNSWSWTDNKPVEDPQNFMLSSVQDYILQLYNTENDALLDNMRRIAEAVLKQYPDHVESLSNISIVYLLNKEYDKALEPLLKAEKLNPKDYIVLSNIAQAYKLKDDNNNAIKYYELTIQYGDDPAKDYAKEQIELLKKK